MPDSQDTWGWYPWSLRRDIELIHPAERQGSEKELRERYAGKIFYCSGETEDGYIILNECESQYRVRPELYRFAPTPTFKYCDLVREISNHERMGTIYFIGWHDKHKREYYLLNINGRRSSKRVFSDELEYAEEV